MKKRMIWSKLHVKAASTEEVSFTVVGKGLKTMNGVTDELTVELNAVVPLKLMVEKFSNQVIYALDSFTEGKNGELPAKAEALFIPFGEGEREFTLDVNAEFPWNGKREKVVTAASALKLVEGMGTEEKEKFMAQLLEG